MQDFKNINLCEKRFKTRLFFAKKYEVFECCGLASRLPKQSPIQLQISGYVPKSNYAFAQLISMPQEFSPMPRFKSLSFITISLITIKLKLNYF